MLVVGAGVNVKILQDAVARGILWQHAFYCRGNHFGCIFLHLLAHGGFAAVTEEARMLVVDLLIELVSGNSNLVGIQHDHMIAGLPVSYKFGTVLAAHHNGNAAAQATEQLIRGVYDVPRWLGGRLGEGGLHGSKGIRP